MTDRTKIFLGISAVVGLLALVGVIAIVLAVLDRVNAPAIAQQPLDASTVVAVQQVDTAEPPPANTPTPAPTLVPCGDGTFAVSQADCTRARQEASNDDVTEPPTAAPQPTIPETVEASDSAGNCHAVDQGTLENNPTFTVEAWTQVNYWSGGPPEYDVLVAPGTYSRPQGYGGRIWEWVGCTEAQATNGITSSWSLRREDGVDIGGWGDPAVLTKLS